jgi:hypothetical protein
MNSLNRFKDQQTLLENKLSEIHALIASFT